MRTDCKFYNLCQHYIQLLILTILKSIALFTMKTDCKLCIYVNITYNCVELTILKPIALFKMRTNLCQHYIQSSIYKPSWNPLLCLQREPIASYAIYVNITYNPVFIDHPENQSPCLQSELISITAIYVNITNTY